jgi:p70 ribosomal S6 kinase
VWVVLQAGEDDVSQFDTKFTKQTPIDSPDESTLSESANLVFQVTCALLCSDVNLLQY